ncbi:hypothetical protein BH24GEM2_BH24GEM2_18650 [soil metagenome]
MQNTSTNRIQRQNVCTRARLAPSCLALLGWLGLRLPFGLGPEWVLLGVTRRLGWRAEVWGAAREGQAAFRILVGGKHLVEVRSVGNFEEAWAHARADAEGRLSVRAHGRGRPGRLIPARHRGSAAPKEVLQAA